MKSFVFVNLLYFFVFVFSIGASAQTVTAFTSDSVDSRLQYNFGRAIAVGGGGGIDIIHQVWVEATAHYDTTEVQGKIMFRFSPDGGTTWSPSRALTGSIRTGYPKVAAYGPYVYVVYHQTDSAGMKTNLIYSQQFGQDWFQVSAVPAAKVVANCGGFPSVAASYNFVHVVVSCYGPLNKFAEVYHRAAQITSSGITWLSAAPRMVSNSDYLGTPGAGDNRSSWTPDVAAEGPDVYISWTDERHNTVDCSLTNSEECFEEVYLRRSQDLGRTWLNEQRITYSPVNVGHNASSIAVSKGTVHLTLTRKTAWDIFYVRLTERGSKLQPEVKIAADTTILFERPTVAVFGSNVQIVFHGITPGVSMKVYRTQSIDGGLKFSAGGDAGAGYSIIPNTLGISFMPSLAIDSKGKAHLIFAGANLTGDSTYQIFYGRW